jgi:outer membrane lipopolysaccharide assembly protein LptE/RlpB
MTLLSIAVLLTGCVWMYSTRPGTIPPHIKSVAIDETINNTAEFNLGQDFMTLLIDKMQLENLLPLDDESVANSIIYTSITRINDNVYSYDETEVVKEYKLSLNIDFRWYDAINETDIMKNLLSDYEIYYSDTYNNSLSSDEQVTREVALERLKDKMADKVIIELTSQW